MIRIPTGADPPALGDRQGGEDPLGRQVRALFTDLAHAGDLSVQRGSTAAAGEQCLTGTAGRIDEGTQVRFSLRLRGGRVLEVRYRAYGCPYTLACCEWLARRLAEIELSEPWAAALRAAVGTPIDWARELAIPQARLGRLLIVEDALESAILRRSMQVFEQAHPPQGF